MCTSLWLGRKFPIELTSFFDPFKKRITYRITSVIRPWPFVTVLITYRFVIRPPFRYKAMFGLITERGRPYIRYKAVIRPPPFRYRATWWPYNGTDPLPFRIKNRASADLIRPWPCIRGKAFFRLRGPLRSQGSLDNSYFVVGVPILSQGSQNNALFEKKTIFRNALQCWLEPYHLLL